ncbi:acyltransferase [Caulobacter segnis]|uniref:acyltransferase family protein n=1 Tax=Caulobacter segnis TaxID=88688 RepID=UPI00240EBC3D|nr:acyltransferase [Caulobacter segnis]MDG2523193.1 acyltransferase [Caulobacter segnis]
MRTLYSIQSLRGLAALSVAAFHAAQWSRLDFEIGAAGVDVFFVISGFIMEAMAADRRQEPGPFILRRITRVVPLYWALSLLAFGIAFFWRGAIPRIIPDWGHLGLSLAFIPHVDPDGWPFPLIPPGWSLHYEALFYLTFAAALVFAPDGRLKFVTMALAVVCVFGAAFPPAYLVLANPMLMEFVAGMALARAWRSGDLPGRGMAVVMLAVAFVILAIQHFAAFVPGNWRPITWGVPAVLIVTAALSFEEARIFRLPILQRMGDASYSIYLTHILVAPLVARLIWPGLPWIFIPAMLLVAALCGLICHQCVEKPLIEGARRLAKT